MIKRLRGAERVWPTRNEAQPNGEGVASGGATENLKKIHKLRQSPFARKAFCITGRAGPLACAAAADRLRP